MIRRMRAARPGSIEAPSIRTVNALLCALKRPTPVPELRERLRDFHVKAWEHFLILAIARHRVAPAVATALDALGEGVVPPGVLDRFRAEARAVALHSLEQKARTGAIVAALNRCGIEPILLKGWVLEDLLSGTLGQRVSRDIDILIRPAELRAASAALHELGYRCLTAMPQDDVALAAFLTTNMEFEFVDAAGRMRVELHVRQLLVPRILRKRFSKRKHTAYVQANASRGSARSRARLASSISRCTVICIASRARSG